MIRLGMFIGDRYEILDPVGSGGMSDVYKGKDHKLNRFVAVKVLKNEYSNDKNFVTKFRVEAQSAAGLAHPNIVNVYDVGEEDGIHYIVMELVEGITLKNYIQKKGKLSIKEAISIAIQMAMGIEAAHNNHIIHRDIKPQNIIISKDGKVKVTDFGIARAASSNTIASSVMGSVHYTSPEQARGGYSDEKSDIYSLGITMYEMLTGKVPFDGDNTVAIAIQHIQDEMVSPRVYSPDIPISLEQIIFKCTQKSPDRRYQNMAEVISDLKQSLVHPDMDFVQIMSPDANAKTVMITDDEITKIKGESGKSSVNPIPVKKDLRKIEEEEDEDEDDDEDDEEEDMNPKLEKVMTVLGIVAGVIILIIVLYLAANAIGLFRGSSGSGNPVQTEDSSEESKATSNNTDAKTVTMINVVGKTYEDARTALKELPLGIKQVASEPSDLYETGIVIKQNIDEGEAVDKNTTIEVTVSSGKTSTKVPDVLGKAEDEARSILESAGYSVSSTTDYSSTVKEGNVISSSPAPDMELAKGEEIKIVVSSGPKTESVSVPDIGNMVETEAKASLEYAGLTVGTVSTAYSSTIGTGRVMSQSYAKGKSVPKGTAVDFVISMGAEEEQEQSEYTGTVKIPKTSLPTDFTSGTIKLDLTQDGETKTVFEGTLTINDFPYPYTMTGKAGVTTGTVKMYIDDKAVDGTFQVTFKKAS